MFFTLPTLLTWARIVAIPLIVGLFYLPAEPATRNLAATVLFVVVALTDWLGFAGADVRRWRSLVSSAGVARGRLRLLPQPSVVHPGD